MTESNAPSNASESLWYVMYYNDENDVHGFFIAESDNHMTALAMAGPVCSALMTRGAPIPERCRSVYYPHRNRFIPWEEATRIFNTPRPDEDWVLPDEKQIN